MRDHAFWIWSLEVYDRPGMKEVCLDLQNRHGANVNILLWIGWLSQQGQGCAPLVSQANNAIQDWNRSVTRPIRSLRQSINKEQYGSLYNSLLESELLAEKEEQNRLFAISKGAAPSSDSPDNLTQAALESYARILDQNIDFYSFLKTVSSSVKKV